jgi:hypothetical protein
MKVYRPAYAYCNATAGVCTAPVRACVTTLVTQGDDTRGFSTNMCAKHAGAYFERLLNGDDRVYRITAPDMEGLPGRS